LHGGRASSFEGMQKWTQVVYEHVQAHPEFSGRNIQEAATEIYRAAVIQVPEAEKSISLRSFIDALEEINRTNQAMNTAGDEEVGSNIRVMSQGEISLPAHARKTPNQLLNANPRLAAGESFFLVPDPARPPENPHAASSRLVLNPHPKHMPLLARAMASVISTTDEVSQGKVGAYDWLGNRSDDAIMYLCDPDQLCAESVVAKLHAAIEDLNGGAIPHDMFLGVQPPGGELMAPGIYYAETAALHVDSVATDRGRIVAEAIIQSDQQAAALTPNLKRAIAASGYDPEYPAFILAEQGDADEIEDSAESPMRT
jgi:hypothetical protein